MCPTCSGVSCIDNKSSEVVWLISSCEDADVPEDTYTAVGTSAAADAAVDRIVCCCVMHSCTHIRKWHVGHGGVQCQLLQGWHSCYDGHCLRPAAEYHTGFRASPRRKLDKDCSTLRLPGMHQWVCMVLMSTLASRHNHQTESSRHTAEQRKGPTAVEPCELHGLDSADPAICRTPAAWNTFKIERVGTDARLLLKVKSPLRTAAQGAARATCGSNNK